MLLELSKAIPVGYTDVVQVADAVDEMMPVAETFATL